MDRSKLLEQIRSEKNDEGVQHVKNRGLNLGYKIFLGICIGLIVFNLFTDQNSYSIQSLFWAFIAAESYSQHQYKGDKTSQVTMIAAGLASVAFLVSYVLYSLG